MKTQTDYDVYRDCTDVINESAKDAIEWIKKKNEKGLRDKFNVDHLFFIASKGTKSKKIVWDLVRKSKVTVLRAHDRPNEYQKILDSVKKECSNH